jgi:flagellar biosynthesis protein
VADEPKRAVALRYDAARGDAAPKVVAKGRGATAERILDLARRNNVPVREDVNLVRVLAGLKIDQEIPPELYQVVAALLALLYRANRPG